MTCSPKRAIYTAPGIIFLMVMVCACGNSAANQAANQNPAFFPFSSFRDIPGVTEDEIYAIESLKKRTDRLVYGVPPGTETFITESGEIEGYTALLCDW